MNSTAGDFLVQLLPLLLMQGMLLFAVVPLASKSSRSAWIWVLFSLIPFLGTFAFPILLGRSVAVLLGRVEALSSKIDTKQ